MAADAHPLQEADSRALWPLACVLLLRGALFWAGFRLMLQMVMLTAVPIRLEEGAGSLAVASVAFLAFFDARRRNEVLLLQNLGIAPWLVACAGVIPPAILELFVP